MGYLTYHELSIHDDQGRWLSLDEIKDELVQYIDHNPFIESCKWYDHVEDMKWLSKKYGGTVFKLTGEGEDSTDLWIEYHLNGKVQKSKAVITYEEYSPDKLK